MGWRSSSDLQSKSRACTYVGVMLALAGARKMAAGSSGNTPARPAARTPTRSEQRLAGRLARGEERALKQIEKEYSGLLRGYLQQVLGDRATAEDVLQQVMLEVWQRGKSFDPSRASVSTWVMMIARSRAIDHLRRRVPEPHDPSVTASLIDRMAPQEHIAETLAEQWQMAHLLTQLPREEAQILRMRFHEELSQREIAARTGIPLGTVKTRMVSALARLRVLMEREV
jgi:RNA polymerase sigma-70 factor (ECF subfamily)